LSETHYGRENRREFEKKRNSSSRSEKWKGRGKTKKKQTEEKGNLADFCKQQQKTCGAGRKIAKKGGQGKKGRKVLKKTRGETVPERAQETVRPG